MNTHGYLHNRIEKEGDLIFNLLNSLVFSSPHAAASYYFSKHFVSLRSALMNLAPVMFVPTKFTLKSHIFAEGTLSSSMLFYFKLERSFGEISFLQICTFIIAPRILTPFSLRSLRFNSFKSVHRKSLALNSPENPHQNNI